MTITIDSVEQENEILLDCEGFFKEMESDENRSMANSAYIAGNPVSALTPIDLLNDYYSRRFPLKMIVRWLAYGNERQYLANREFSFTLKNDIYVRYLSFDSAASFAVKLQKDLPIKIDIGAVYNTRPNERKSLIGATMKPVEHELVFDIDMTDYNDVRTCCQYSLCSYRC